MRFASGLLSILLASFLGGPLFAQRTYPEIPFDSVGSVLKPIPLDLARGEYSGVAVNSKGHIFVVCRCGDVQLTTGTSRAFMRGYGRLREFDQNGNFIREVGQNNYNMVWPERVRVDPQDNIWVMDSGAQTVTKFSSDLHILMILGRRPEAVEVPAQPESGPNPPGFGAGIPGDNFDRPTDVAWDAAGDIFVTDGHGGHTHARVVKFDKNGRFLKSWGSDGTKPGEFNTPHSIAVDAQGNVYVADRSNGRIQVFDNDGNFKTEWRQQGTPFALCISHGPHQYLYSMFANFPQEIAHGQIYKMELDGTIVGQFGKSGTGPDDFRTGHSMDCSKTNPNEIYTSEFTGWRVHKVILHPERMASAR